MQDVQPHFLTGDFGTFVCRKDPPSTPGDEELVRKKVVQVCLKGYIEVGLVVSLIHYFHVKKGIFDVRMVYNGTGCGLNDSVWAPHFGLPTVRQILHSLVPDYSQCDLDIGEMFLNFLLNNTMKEMPGVDVQHVRSNEAALPR